MEQHEREQAKEQLRRFRGDVWDVRSRLRLQGGHPSLAHLGLTARVRSSWPLPRRWLRTTSKSSAAFSSHTTRKPCWRGAPKCDARPAATASAGSSEAAAASRLHPRRRRIRPRAGARCCTRRRGPGRAAWRTTCCGSATQWTKLIQRTRTRRRCSRQRGRGIQPWSSYCCSTTQTSSGGTPPGGPPSTGPPPAAGRAHCARWSRPRPLNRALPPSC